MQSSQALDDISLLLRSPLQPTPWQHVCPPPEPMFNFAPSHFPFLPPPRLIFHDTIHVASSIFATLKTISCWTSARMTDLMQWRNPQALEAGSDAITCAIEIGKKALTALTLPLLTLSAAVETVAYSAIIFAAQVLSPITQKPQEFVKEHEIVQLQRSARFTCWWTIAAHVKNISTRSLPTSENLAQVLY